MEIRKVLLVIPPCTLPKGRLKITVPSLGVLYLGAVLQKEGYEVRVVDAPLEGFRQEVMVTKRNIRYGLSYEQIASIIRRFNPQVVGVSCQSALEYHNAIEACQTVKRVDSRIVTVMGGPHPSSFPKEVLTAEKSIDYVIISEGEISFRDLLRGLQAAQPDLTGVDGLAWHDHGTVRVNPKKTLVRNLDELPFPARHLVPVEKYFEINLNQNLSFIKRALTIVTSRGCPHRCIFCFGTNFWMHSYRTRSAENVLAEIDAMVAQYKIAELQFTDDSLTSDYDRAMQIFLMLKERRYGFKWSTPNGINVISLDEPLMRAMKESGCYEMRFAIESGNEEVLKNIIHKPVNLAIVRKNMKIAKKLGIITSAFFSMGYPGETMEQIKETFAFVREIKPDSIFLSIATPLPGTELMRICQEKGYVSKDHDFLTAEFSTASFDTEHFNRRELEELYFREALVLNVSLVVRNFRAFLVRWGRLVRYHPVFALKVVANYYLRTKRTGAYGED